MNNIQGQKVEKWREHPAAGRQRLQLHPPRCRCRIEEGSKAFPAHILRSNDAVPRIWPTACTGCSPMAPTAA